MEHHSLQILSKICKYVCILPFFLLQHNRLVASDSFVCDFLQMLSKQHNSDEDNVNSYVNGALNFSFFDQELIPYHYSSCSGCCWGMLFIKFKALLFLDRSGGNFASLFLKKICID